MLFEDRQHAGELLAKKLIAYRGQSPLILAVPRGGISVALPLWRHLGGELDLIITRKLGAPGRPELAIGAVTGDTICCSMKPWSHRSGCRMDTWSEFPRRSRLRSPAASIFTGNAPAAGYCERLVIVVDDGVATWVYPACCPARVKQGRPRKLVRSGSRRST